MIIADATIMKLPEAPYLFQKYEGNMRT